MRFNSLWLLLILVSFRMQETCVVPQKLISVNYILELSLIFPVLDWIFLFFLLNEFICSLFSKLKG